jgi:transcriptional regulator with XRE-family HTH domain
MEASEMQGEEIKRLRKSAGLSQAEMGELLGMSRETVGAMERGTAPIEKRTAEVVDLHLRHRIDVAYSPALKRWTVSITGPGPAGSGVSRRHEVRAALESKDAAVALAETVRAHELPFSRLLIRHEQA